MIRLVFLALLLVLGACSSGGGSSGKGGEPGSNYPALSITVDAPQVDFIVGLQESASRAVAVRFVGDAVIVGAPAGQSVPGWLGVQELGQSKGEAFFELHAFGVAPGTYTTTLRFLTGWIETEEIKYVDVRITLVVKEAPGVSIGTVNTIVIDNSLGEDELMFSIPVTPSESAVTWRIAAASALLHAEKNNGNSAIDLTIDRAKAGISENGVREEWVDLVYSYLGRETQVRIPVTVEIAFTGVKTVSPRVLYSGEDTTVRVRGPGVGQLGLGGILVGETLISSVTRINASEVELLIPGTLPEGEHTITLPDSPSILWEPVTLVVKPHAIYPIEALTLPATPTQIIYDPAREQFHYSGGYSGYAVYTLSHDGESWMWSQFPITAPAGIGLSQNGKKLLVGTYECELWEIELETSEITSPFPLNSCFYEHFGLVAPLYTGLTLVADTNQWPSMWSYPDWAGVGFNFPGEHSPFGLVSLHGTYMIWAGGPTTSGPRAAYVYNARDNVFNTLGTVGENYYLDFLFSISANGNRISHFDDIYNGQLAYMGSLSSGGDDSLNRVGISPKGSLAGLFDWQTKSLRIFDISGRAPFPELDYELMLPEETPMVSRIMFSEDDRYMFVFANNVDTNLNKMYVFELQ